MANVFLGNLEDYVEFYDGSKQLTRLGRDESCFHTRWVLDRDRVSGETVLIAVTITDQFISMTVNGKNYVSNHGVHYTSKDSKVLSLRQKILLSLHQK